MKTFYIFSLGNPVDSKQTKYKYTRHNAGRILCNIFDFKKLSENEKVKLEYIIPDCYMNESGKFILDYIKYKNVEASSIVVAYDDIDINFGDLKLSFGRSSGGHNGVESVIQALNTKDFYRIRVGIGEKKIKEMLLQDYVLSKLEEQEIKYLESKEIQNKLEIKLKELLELVI